MKYYFLAVLLFFIAISANAESNNSTDFTQVNEAATSAIADCSDVVMPGTWLIKSNAIGLAMLIGNASGEYQFDEHYSLDLPIYYSDLNYFTSTRKYRTFTFQPELRYNLSKNGKWFAGLHATFCWYNFTIGDFRYQDYKYYPGVGAGISIGYRTLISKNGKWILEASIGGGYLYTSYNKYYNVHNGSLAESNIVKHYVGIDHIGLSVCYRLDLRREKK